MKSVLRGRRKREFVQLMRGNKDKLRKSGDKNGMTTSSGLDHHQAEPGDRFVR